MTIRIEDRADDSGTVVRWIEINRAACANALDLASLNELRQRIETAGAMDNVGALVICAAGARHFCAGADRHESQSIERAQAYRENLGQLLGACLRLCKPLVAAIDGSAVGGGAMLACVVDRAIVADDTFFCFPEIDLSIPPVLAFELLADSVGASVARDWICTGRRIPSPEALERGMISEIVPRMEVRTVAGRAASALAGKPKCAYARLKSHVAERYQSAIERSLQRQIL
jgi:enoyl-CoA hydratase/carnithine racemase